MAQNHLLKLNLWPTVAWTIEHVIVLRWLIEYHSPTYLLVKFTTSVLYSQVRWVFQWWIVLRFGKQLLGISELKWWVILSHLRHVSPSPVGELLDLVLEETFILLITADHLFEVLILGPNNWPRHASPCLLIVRCPLFFLFRIQFFLLIVIGVISCIHPVYMLVQTEFLGNLPAYDILEVH